MQIKKKVLAVVTAGALLLGSVLPAFAASYSNPTSVQAVSAETNVYNAKVAVTVPAGAMGYTGATGASLRLTLPADYKFLQNVATSGSLTTDGLIDQGVSNQIYQVDGFVVAGGAVDDDYVQIKVYGQSTASLGSLVGEGKMTINLPGIKVPSGASGDVKVAIAAQPGSPFTGGEVVIATVGTGTVNLSLEGTKTITSSGGTLKKIYIQEDRAGAIVSDAETLKIKLPNGFTWGAVSPANLDVVWGDASKITGFAVDPSDDRTVILATNGVSGSALYAAIKNLPVEVDPTTAKAGDIKVTISGASSTNLTEVVVGTYGDFSVTGSVVGDAPTVFAGKTEQETAKFQAQESVAASLAQGRTIFLTIPENVNLEGNPTIKASDSDLGGIALSSGTQLTEIGTTRVYSATVNTASSTAAKIVFDKVKFNTAVDFTGDVVFEFSGSAGLSGKLTVAKVVAPVAAKVASTPDVKIGLYGQKVGDLEITEAAKEIMDSASGQNNIYVTAPAGVTFDKIPTVTVTAGDVTLGTIAQSNGVVTIPVKSTSSAPATIKLSDMVVTLDRTVPEGNMEFKVNGTVAGAFNAIDKVAAANHLTIAKVVVANVATPAPSDLKNVNVFTIGSTTYTVNGVEKTIDAAPYIKNDRTYMGLRVVANVTGVSDDNILWDAANQSATLIKGDRVVQVTVGSKTMLLNGSTITMDVAPEIVDPGRVMLPTSWIAKALGVSVTWDATAQTVTVQ